MQRGCRRFRARQAQQALAASGRENGEARPAFPQRPLEQRITAAGDDRRRLTQMLALEIHLLFYPEVDQQSRKEQFPADARAWNALAAHQFIDGALPQPQILGHFTRGHQVGILHMTAISCIHYIVCKVPDYLHTDAKGKGMMGQENAFAAAIRLIAEFDPTLVEIVLLSLRVSLTAVLLAALLGLPLGTALAIYRFRGRAGVIVVSNALMGLPPVVAGLVVYLLLSRSGPLGPLGILFTPTAMVIAQTLLILPIIISLTRQVMEDLWVEYQEQLRSLGSTTARAIPTLLWDGRFSLITSILAGFGRASAEVGAVRIVGGNIAGYTRTMTTAIALETARGDLALALGLGILLITLTLVLNAIAYGTGRMAQRAAA